MPPKASWAWDPEHQDLQRQKQWPAGVQWDWANTEFPWGWRITNVVGLVAEPQETHFYFYLCLSSLAGVRAFLPIELSFPPPHTPLAELTVSRVGKGETPQWSPAQHGVSNYYHAYYFIFPSWGWQSNPWFWCEGCVSTETQVSEIMSMQIFIICSRMKNNSQLTRHDPTRKSTFDIMNGFANPVTRAIGQGFS